MNHTRGVKLADFWIKLRGTSGVLIGLVFLIIDALGNDAYTPFDGGPLVFFSGISLILYIVWLYHPHLRFLMWVYILISISNLGFLASGAAIHILCNLDHSNISPERYGGVLVRNGKWTCPICKHSNLHTERCTNCQYAPVLIVHESDAGPHYYNNAEESEYDQAETWYEDVAWDGSTDDDGAYPDDSMDAWVDYYEELEISRGASAETIKAAYCALYQKYHPDTYPGDKVYATQKFQRINEAYQVLSNETAKRVYDAAYDRERHTKIQEPSVPTPSAPQEKAKRTVKNPRRKVATAILIMIAAFVVIGCIIGGIGLLQKKEKDIQYLATISVDYNLPVTYYCTVNMTVKADEWTLKSIKLPSGEVIESTHRIYDQNNTITITTYDAVLGTISTTLHLIEELDDDSARLINTTYNMITRTNPSDWRIYAGADSDMCHVSRCQYAKNIDEKNRLYFPSRQAAALMGFASTCSNCRNINAY